MDPNRHRRVSIKAQHPNWKDEFRQSCLRRVQKERDKLLWKIRTQNEKPSNEKIEVEFMVRDIVSDEFEKIKESSSFLDEKLKDEIWEFEGPICKYNFDGVESEDFLLEMESLLYQDIREELIRRELEYLEEEEAYLAQEAFEHMQLNEKQEMQNKVWCPVCKKGELKEAKNLIFCTNCKMQLDIGDDKVNVEFLRDRLAEVHMTHLDRGCKLSPKFCVETKFGLTALCINCDACSTFEIVF
ncbi:hypothetical protein LUZ60_001919 [Juncus effusus]|nr:hypothetical protein LUZ60_001919 [Juncus effusus]